MMTDMISANAHISKAPRQFLPESFQLTTWEQLQPYFENLQQRNIDTLPALQQWLQDASELEAVISEDACWRQINMTCDTTNKAYEEAFTYFCTDIEPQMKPYFFELNKKLLAAPHLHELDAQRYFPYLRQLQNAVALYREANVPIQAEINLLAQQYGVISGKMTVTIDDKEYTLQQAARFLQNPDRSLREKVYRQIAARRLQDQEELNNLFDKLLHLRHQIATNAGFDNYRDYKFKELGRFDYTAEDCFAFHEAVKQHILPLHKRLVEHRKNRLKLSEMKPWDSDAEPSNVQPLRPFETGQELTEKTIAVFQQLRPFFAECIKTMVSMQRLDLESRIGKAPGGYNCPLAETGVPFIFMNAAGTINDVITMMHEGGHAVHSFLAHPLPLTAFKEYPMEIAELASMSMELFSMEHWNIFFSDNDSFQRAQAEELERVISVLPWIATIDKFQHWLYTHHGHTHAQRTDAWMQILNEFSTGVVDWSDFNDYRQMFWQKQLHLYEVPFYYIEYGIAQLGALAMWRQYREDKESTLDNYMKALQLGYTRPLQELYATAGIRFDFSPAYIQEISGFVKERLAAAGIQ